MRDPEEIIAEERIRESARLQVWSQLLSGLAGQALIIAAVLVALGLLGLKLLDWMSL